MNKVTEEDIINYYQPLVIQECKNSFKGFEWQDRVGEASEALLYSIRTYKTKYGIFEDYMLLQLRKIMNQKNKEAWAMKRLESQFSLDAPFVNCQGNDSLSSIIGISQDETLLDVQCFIEALSYIEKRVVDLLLNNCSIGLVSNELSLPLTQIQLIIDGLKVKASAYFGK
jgi:hypothetical protein